MVMKSFNTVIVLVDVVVLIVLALCITLSPPSSSLSKRVRVLFPFHVMVSCTNDHTERVHLVCFCFFFLPVVLQLMVNISAWHQEMCSFSGHVVMVLFLS